MNKLLFWGALILLVALIILSVINSKFEPYLGIASVVEAILYIYWLLKSRKRNG